MRTCYFFIIATLCLMYNIEAVGMTTTFVWKPGALLTSEQVSTIGEDSLFVITSIDSITFARMQQGGSYPRGCTIKPTELRYLKLLHYNYQGRIECGEMVCNKAIAEDIREIFMELYHNKYQIERMRLIDDYGADDDKSMKANNTSSFCYRTVAGSKTLSYHARGMAVDVNPLHNPMVKYNSTGKVVKVSPDTAESRKYISRNPTLGHVINKDDLCYRLFLQHGFICGGTWRYTKDYQHFEKR